MSEEKVGKGIDDDVKHERIPEMVADLRYLGNSGYPRLKKGKKWGDWDLKTLLKYFAKVVDKMREIDPDNIPEQPKEKVKTSYWKCYWEAKKYMKSKPGKIKNG